MGALWGPTAQCSSSRTPALLPALSRSVKWGRAMPGGVEGQRSSNNTGRNYGAEFVESDLRADSAARRPFGVLAFLGDDAWVRARPGDAQNSVRRPSPDDRHTSVIWHAPEGGGQVTTPFVFGFLVAMDDARPVIDDGVLCL